MDSVRMMKLFTLQRVRDMMLNKQLKGRAGQRGVTLLEIMMATVLLGLIGIGVGALISSSTRHLIRTTSTTRAQNGISFALEHMKRHLIMATAHERFPVAGALNRLEFDWMPGGFGGVTVTSGYRLTGNILEYEDNVNVAPTWDFDLAGDVSLFEVTRLNNAEVQIAVTVTDPVTGIDTRLETTVSSRGVPNL